MPYHFLTPRDEREMLGAIGIASIDELFAGIPPEFRLKRPLKLPASMCELELTQHMTMLASRNAHAQQNLCFLGGGSYDHFIPAVVDALASRGEFYTSYTPYQPEVSQGTLQAMFEYQTMICRLTGMEVSNASLYDGGSAVTEAALMALSSAPNRGKVIVPDTVHPEYRQILATYLQNAQGELVTVSTAVEHDGMTHVGSLTGRIDQDTACVIVQQPNFFGSLEEVAQIAEIAHARGAILIVSVDPISLGILRRPGDLGADIVVAEGQSLGSPMQFGGPYLGILACREEFLRRMPGRIAGQTLDHGGKTCWVLTMQTREQHIRRDKATSNICTNQGLFALRACIYLSLMGPQGLREVAELSTQKAHYAAQLVQGSKRFRSRWNQTFFKEFVVQDRSDQVLDCLAKAREQGVLAGIPLGGWYPELDDSFLVAVTEQRTRVEMDRWISCLSQESVSRREALHHA